MDGIWTFEGGLQGGQATSADRHVNLGELGLEPKAVQLRPVPKSGAAHQDELEPNGDQQLQDRRERIPWDADAAVDLVNDFLARLAPPPGLAGRLQFRVGSHRRPRIAKDRAKLSEAVRGGHAVVGEVARHLPAPASSVCTSSSTPANRLNRINMSRNHREWHGFQIPRGRRHRYCATKPSYWVG
ncbi:hypothetical protein AB8Z38_30275 [Bradyrhizobium sp. LLZ17]|uniref:Uncharacterized protein n=1 Tax=Bradyrhizobium sp. LLZ17 TaxID=3239388 RepID=A0AB39XI80_9BRAD